MSDLARAVLWKMYCLSGVAVMKRAVPYLDLLPPSIGVEMRATLLMVEELEKEELNRESVDE